MTAPPRMGIPLRPDRDALARGNVAALARSCLASGRAVFESSSTASEIVRRTWSDDPLAAVIVRAASAPHTMANSPALLHAVVNDVLAVLGPVSAGAQLLRQGLALSFGRDASISVPALIADANHASFVAEGQPIPVYAFNVAAGVTLAPHKIAALWSLTREQIESSNAQALVEDAMKRSAGLALDKYLFDAAAGDDVRPAGLRYNIAALTAATGMDSFEMMLSDIATLFKAVAPLGGPVVLIGSTVRAKMMPLRLRGGDSPAILGSPAVADDDLLAIATDAVAAAIDGSIEIRSAKQATMQQESTPSELTAGPTISVFQTDTISQRLRLPITWSLRDARGVAWLTTTWKEVVQQQ